MATNSDLTPDVSVHSLKRIRKPKENEPSKHDEIINDILKHLTTLNTGLLAILAAFSGQFAELLKSNHAIGAAFLYSFYMSLLFCMLGFMLTIIALQLENPRRRKNTSIVRDVVILVAALGYIIALMFFVTLYSNSLNLFT